METANTRRTVQKLVLVVIGMFAFGYALVPLYNVFCDITGLNGKTGVITQANASDMVANPDRLITIEFIATVNAGLSWDFKPMKYRMQVHPGELYSIHYLAENKTDQDITGQAVPSVAPGQAGTYFNKTECFCFTQQTLKAHEKREMPVRFIVDPRLPEQISTITLSYTFFNLNNKVSANHDTNNQASSL